MYDLVGNPKDRFSRDVAHMVKHMRFCYLSNGQAVESMEVNKGPDLAPRL